MDKQEIRRQFEEWFLKEMEIDVSALRNHDEDTESEWPYSSGTPESILAITIAFKAWQASRAAIVVELPAAYMGCHGDAIGPSDFNDVNEMHTITKFEKWTPLYYSPAVNGNSPEIPDGWVSCDERMPVIGENDWRTALPVLVKCEMDVIPAYYGFTYHEGEQCFGFMESVKFGDASGSGPEQHENRLMMHVTHWMPLPAPPNQEK